MKLLDEIIDLASGEAGSVSTILRKCLVLAHTLKNDRLKVWAENELKGYAASDDPAIPDYRKARGVAKGLFLGGFGAQIDSQPIPSAMMEAEHRQFAETVVLTQPIAAYEDANKKSNMRFEWPANLTGLYQTTFFGGTLTLARLARVVRAAPSGAWRRFLRCPSLQSEPKAILGANVSHGTANTPCRSDI